MGDYVCIFIFLAALGIWFSLLSLGFLIWKWGQYFPLLKTCLQALRAPVRTVSCLNPTLLQGGRSAAWTPASSRPQGIHSLNQLSTENLPKTNPGAWSCSRLVLVTQQGTKSRSNPHGVPHERWTVNQHCKEMWAHQHSIHDPQGTDSATGPVFHAPTVTLEWTVVSSIS